MASHELIIYGAALAPVALVLTLLTVTRAWRNGRRRRFESTTRTALVRYLGFQSVGQKTLYTYMGSRNCTVTFGLSEGGTAGRDLVPSRPHHEPVTPNQRSCVTIEVDCDATLPVPELLVEMNPPNVLRGPADMAYALLEVPMRAMLKESERIQWTPRRLRVTVCQPRSADDIVSLVRKMAATAASIEQSRPRDIERRLVDEALFGKSTEHRLRTIRMLVASHRTPLTKSALVRLCGDRDPVIQLTSARALGEDGIDKLRFLAESPRIPTTIRAAAIDGLLTYHPDGLQVLLTRLMSDPHGEVAALALRGLGQICDARALDAIRSVILKPRTPEGVVLIGINVLEKIGFDAAEDTIRELSVHRSERVQSAAIDVIGRHGDIQWLQVLTRRLRRYALPMDLTVSMEAAIALIRSRHRAGAGRLSLSPESSSVPLGALSPPPPQGAVAVAATETKSG